MQSSANCFSLCIECPIFRPLIFTLFLILLLIISAHKIKRRHERGQPCLIPLKSSNQLVVKPLLLTQLKIFVWKHLTREIKSSPKLNFLNTSNIHSHSTESKAFSKSICRIIPPLSSLSNFSIISSTNLIDSPIYLPLTNPD